MKKKLFIALTSLLIFAIGATGIGLFGWYLALKNKGDGPKNEIHTHEYTVQSVNEPTCTGKGYSSFVCECGKTRVGEYKDALGHDPDGDNICTRCGFLQHEHEYEKTVTVPTCTEAGYTRGDCNYCTAGFITDYTDPLGHDFVNGKCTRCNYDENSTVGMEYTLSDDGGYYILSGIGTATVTEVFIPQTHNGKPVKEIGDRAFSLGKITHLFIPDGVTKIGESAFIYCSLKSITMPDSVTHIGNNAFYMCSLLTDLNFKGTKAQWNAIEKDNSLSYYAINCTVHCTDGDIEKAADPVATKDGLLYTLSDDGKYYICSGTDASISSIITDANIASQVNGLPVNAIEADAFKNNREIQHVTIPDSVTGIGNNVFQGCKSLTEITIPERITRIGAFMFSGCSALTYVKLGSRITYIENNVFQNCKSLTEITIPDSVNRIGELVFSGCSALTYVKLGSNLKNISGNAFGNCVSIKSIVIPDSVITVGDNAFASCTNLSDIKIGNRVTSIGNAAFRECVNLTNVIIPDSVTAISDYAFYGCEKLKSITIPGGVTNFSSYTFSSCPLFTDIIFKGTVAQWQSIRGSSWFFLATSCTVHCTDGELIINKK